MTFSVHRLIDNEYLGTVRAQDIIHAAVKAAEEFRDEGLCRIEEVDLRDVVTGWHADGKAVGRG